VTSSWLEPAASPIIRWPASRRPPWVHDRRTIAHKQMLEDGAPPELLRQPPQVPALIETLVSEAVRGLAVMRSGGE